MRDRDIQHPDITAAELTGYPRRFLPELPDHETLAREFILDKGDDFFEWCMGKADLVEDYLCECRAEYQDWQYNNYRAIGW